MRRPQIRNHRLARWLIVDKTSALMTALSRLLIVSNKHNPRTTRIIERTSNMCHARNIPPLFIVEACKLNKMDRVGKRRVLTVNLK